MPRGSKSNRPYNQGEGGGGGTKLHLRICIIIIIFKFAICGKRMLSSDQEKPIVGSNDLPLLLPRLQS